LYEDLGVAPSADQEQLRRRYRQRARELHPDVNSDVEDDSAMQRLNAAWAVLGDPESRLRYDRQLGDQPRPTLPPPPPADAPATAAGGARQSPPEPSLPSAIGWFRLLRPSVIIPGVLLLIFIITAYAGHPGAGGTAPSPAPVSPARQPVPSGVTDPAVTVPASAFVGRCIRDQTGSVTLVPCSDRPNSLVIAVVPAAGACPTGTSNYFVASQTEMLCADPSGP
jgi:hypothetical protein